jgi:ribosomal protein L40E
MEETAKNTIGESICPQCGDRPNVGRIFCRKCGAILRPPVSLNDSTNVSTASIPVSSWKRAVVAVVKGIAGLAAVVFIFSPISNRTGILAFGASIFAFLICYATLSKLGDNSFDRHVKSGYWPSPPMNWSPRTGQQNWDKKRTNRTRASSLMLFQ